MKTTEERHSEYNKTSKRAQFQILAHYLGCRKECNMSEEEALIASVDNYFRDEHGFIIPLQFNVTKYSPIVASRFPELNVGNRVYTEWKIEYVYGSSKKEEVTNNKTVKESVKWWESKRPLEWMLETHLENPTVNCASEAEKNLAIEVAKYVGENNG